MEEEREDIDEFPGYEVSNFGEVFNLIRRSKPMAWSPTQQGDPTVGLMRDGHQYRRTVKMLVARAFVKGESRVFNSPIQLDGDKTNCRADNILWRPRWFAWKYAHQFVDPHEAYFEGRVVSIHDGIEYENPMHASMSRGLLAEDIIQACMNGSRVFPTGDYFEYI